MLGVLIAAALLMTRGERAYANRVLAFSVAVSAAYLSSTVWRQAYGEDYSLALHLTSLVGVLYGPSIYFYVRTVTGPGFRLGWHHLLHLLPYLAFVLAGTDVLPEAWMYRHRYGVGVLFYLILNAYLGACVYQLYRYRRRIEESFASLEGISLRWLATLVTSIFFLAALGLCFALGRWLTDSVHWPQQMWSVSWMAVISYLIAFFAIFRPAVFNPAIIMLPDVPSGDANAAQPDSGQPDAAQAAPRYQTSSLTEGAAEEIWSILEQSMTGLRHYLEPQLKIGDLSQRLEISQAHLSQTINQRSGGSFFAYVNDYRVRHAQELLRESTPGERTMLDIALASGFNSESAFYKQFRARAGRTPRQFQQENGQ